MAELETGMTAAEFGDWIAMYAIEPWGEFRTDLSGALVAATLANVNRSEHTQPFKPSDFLPRWQVEEIPEMDPAAFVRLTHGR